MSKLQTVLGCAAAGSLAAYAVYRYYTRPQKVVPVEVEREVLVAGEVQESGVDVAYDPEIPDGRHRFAYYMGGLAKGEFGLLERTKANKLVVQHWIRDKMKEHGVRPAHIPNLLPIAVAVAFLPTKADKLAAQILASGTMAEKENEATGWGHWVGSMFSRRVRRPVEWAAK
jgi:hypothetical protein